MTASRAATSAAEPVECPVAKMKNNDAVLIEDYDPAWPNVFSKLAARAMAALGSLAVGVEHIGSTAVPGLAAKPIIDLDVVIALPSDLPEAIRCLSNLGYIHEGDLGITVEAFRPPSDMPPITSICYPQGRTSCAATWLSATPCGQAAIYEPATAR